MTSYDSQNRNMVLVELADDPSDVGLDVELDIVLIQQALGDDAAYRLDFEFAVGSSACPCAIHEECRGLRVILQKIS
ncbi:hypothetical protein [Micrococcus luteus]|uniref:hypothetical protein n=1 Tax=Micrococcus luteus TaxID=1270 RepID=UPI000E0FA779|nr:hypothetical protein [Micrococcus luteus]